jgi:hypothetical protein
MLSPKYPYYMMQYFVYSCILLIMSAVPILVAQEDDEDEEKVYELSPFRVDAAADYGYLTTNSISGTRLNVSLKDLPMMINTINADFIEDIGANNMESALSYQSGVFFQTFKCRFTFSPANCSNAVRTKCFSGL